ncbi:hypothetical protein D029_4816A, partial [Vibrio parahaemolyticus 970107]
MFGCIHSTYTL